MFNKGDIVWAKIHNYSITFYHRPCKVLKCLGSQMRVQVLDSGSTFVVDTNKFELVLEGGILDPGDKLIHKITKEILIFKGYHDCDFIKCVDSDNNVKQYLIQEVERFRRIFYV